MTQAANLAQFANRLNSEGKLDAQTGLYNNAAGGVIAQIVSAKFTNSTQTTSGSYQDTFSSISITPTTLTSKIIIISEGMLAKWDYSGAAIARMTRNGTPIIGDQYLWGSNGFNQAPYQTYTSMTLSTVDEPGLTTLVTYKVQLKNYNAGMAVYGMNDVDGSTMLAIEVIQ
jgi:hypothetical protein